VVTVRRALADTSVFIGVEAARFDENRFADHEWGVSVITLGWEYCKRPARTPRHAGSPHIGLLSGSNR
jgi:hypothetical protein